MRILKLSMFLALSAAANAQEPRELRWNFQKGDSFTLDGSNETTYDSHGPEGDRYSKLTFHLNAKVDVVDVADGVAKLEIRVQSTSGKLVTKLPPKTADQSYVTKASDWKAPILATISARGVLTIDGASAVAAYSVRHIPVVETLVNAFPTLPEEAVKTGDSWTVREATIPESWQVASIKDSSAGASVGLSGKPLEEQEGGAKDSPVLANGNFSAEFDVAAGYVKSATRKVTTEERTSPGAKPTRTVTMNRTLALKKVSAGGK